MVPTPLPGEVSVVDDISDPNAKADLAVVNLTTPMTIEAGNEILVTCSCPIKLSLSPHLHVLVSATTPTLLKAATTMWLDRSDDLGPDFARGWGKLPEEIKLHVLNFTLVLRNGSIGYDDVDGRFTLQDELLSHLAMGPEIARLALEVFYNRNKFLIMIGLPGGGVVLRLPPLVAHPRIWKVVLKCSIDEECWMEIDKFAEVRYGFDNISNFQIDFWWGWGSYGDDDRIYDFLYSDRSDIWFSCPVSINFRGNPDIQLGEDTIRSRFTVTEVRRRMKRLITCDE